MIARTNCQKCIFSTDVRNNTCYIGNDIEDGFYNGFCTFCTYYKDGEDTNEIYNQIIKTFANVCICIRYNGNDNYLDSQIETLKKLNAKEVAILVSNIEDLKRIYNKVASFMSWKCFIATCDIETYIAENCRSNWFVIFDDTVDEILVDKFNSLIYDRDIKFCALRKSKFTILNKFAFKNLDGNNEMPVLDKLKRFDNYKDLVKEIDG